MRAVARLVAVLGAVGIGWLVLSASPRNVVLVYDLSGTPGAMALDVEIRRGGGIVRRAEIGVPRGSHEVRHSMKLPEGAYALAWRISEPGGSISGERPLEIREEGTIVLPLGR